MLANHERWLRLLSVSWPLRAEVHADRWTGDPAWDAPVMPLQPPWRFEVFEGFECNALDWTDIFRMGVRMPYELSAAEMRGFYVVFRLRVLQTGRLIFFATDGCMIRRNGEIVHEDRERHPPRRHELNVRLGDCLEVAQWQSGGRWLWAAHWFGMPFSLEESLAGALPYRRQVEEALARPNGPMLKVFTKGSEPVRGVLAIYSLVLNGYRPAGIQVFGDHQWDARSSRIMRELLPFADIVSLDRVERTLDAVNPGLMALARRVWGAMKIGVGLFFPPYEYCFLDDDIFVVDRMDDALRLWDDHDFVYAPDWDHTGRYSAVPYPRRADHPAPRVLGTVSTGIYLLRNHGDRVAQSERLLATSSDGRQTWEWEQGFFAWEFAYGSSAALSSQRYFVPLFDGLPGGLQGYDWRTNPCEFVCVHFGGSAPKPGDLEAGSLFHEILGRHRTAPAVECEMAGR